MPAASSRASSTLAKDAFRAGQNRHAGLVHGGARFLLQAHAADHFRLGSDEGQAGGLAHFGEVGVLGKETVAGMNGFGVGDFGRADHRRNIQIAARALGRADADGFVGKTRVQAVAVGFRVHRHRADAQILAGADDAQGDFAAVGDQNFFEHAGAA